ncbi:hypothetical protein [Kamptonema formosum]|uniref:hypothetical protein n=1 Tax=Kamptonema formosum TaxID=331992 RepID=UPI00034AD82F|nr:hypothetical protein [Oscillatoria sp. PCC 10802]
MDGPTQALVKKVYIYCLYFKLTVSDSKGLFERPSVPLQLCRTISTAHPLSPVPLPPAPTAARPPEASLRPGLSQPVPAFSSF